MSTEQSIKALRENRSPFFQAPAAQVVDTGFMISNIFCKTSMMGLSGAIFETWVVSEAAWVSCSEGEGGRMISEEETRSGRKHRLSAAGSQAIEDRFALRMHHGHYRDRRRAASPEIG